MNSTSTVLWELGRETAPATRRAPGMAFRLEVSREDKSYPEALTEGTRHRCGKGAGPGTGPPVNA